MRIDYHRHEKVQLAMQGMKVHPDDLGLEPLLLELVKIRASQVNGCAHCLEMHTKDAHALGESEDRLNLIAAWREAPCFTDREKAALLWTEELTKLSDTGAPDTSYEKVLKVFSEDEIVGLTIAIVAINSWNRFAVGFRADVGSYVSPIKKKGQ